MDIVNGTAQLTGHHYVQVGYNPLFAAYDPADERIYVANSGGSNVTVINGTATIANVSVGLHPHSATYNPGDNDVFVPNSGSGANSVSVIGAGPIIAPSVSVTKLKVQVQGGDYQGWVNWTDPPKSATTFKWGVTTGYGATYGLSVPTLSNTSYAYSVDLRTLSSMTTYQFTVSLATSSTGGSNPGLITGSFTTSPPITTYLPPYTDGASGGTYTWCSNLFLVGCSHNTIYANTASASNGQFSDAVESYADVIEGGGSQATVAFQENLGVPGYTGEVKVNFAWSVFWSAEITNLCAIGYAATSGTAVVELEANVWDDTSQSSASNGPVLDYLANTGSYACPLLIGLWGGGTSNVNMPVEVYFNSGDTYSLLTYAFVEVSAVALGLGESTAQAFISYELVGSYGYSYLSDMSWEPTV